jgi:hypothetical protein
MDHDLTAAEARDQIAHSLTLDDTDKLSPEDALEQARDEAERTPEVLLNFLLMHIDASATLPPVDIAATLPPVDVAKWALNDCGDYEVLDVRGLLGVMVGGTSNESRLALHVLRTRMMADRNTQDWIADRAKELQA